MALRVWLPLNGNLNNQGLNGYTYAFNGTYTIEAGKIGQCYKHLNASITNLNGLKDTPMTICFWAKTSDASSSWQKIIMFDNENASQIHGIYVADSARIKYEYSPSLNVTAAPTEWHHYAFVINDKSSQAYYDGVLATTSSEAVSIATLGKIRIAEGAGIYLNDVRIYDECLSPKQIKEISKGLICHYKLDNPYIETTTNMAPGINGLTSYSTNSSPAWDTSLNGSVMYTPSNWSSGYNSGVSDPTHGYHAHWVFDETNKLIMIFPNLNSVINQKNRWLGISGTCSGASDILAGEKYTISWWQKTDNLGLTASGGVYYKKTSSASSSFGDGCPIFGYNTKPNTWQFFSKTFTRASDYVQHSGGQSIYVYGNNGSEGTLYVKDMQIQKGDSATPYAVGTRNGQTYEEDCSGYGYNGIISGSLKYNTDSARHSGSIYFNGSSYITSASGSMAWFPFDNFTVSAWLYPTVTPSNWTGSIGIQQNGNNSGKIFSISNYGGKFSVHTDNSSSGWVTTQSNTLPLNQWSHCVATLTNGTDLKMYINGILVKTATIDYGTATVKSDTRIAIGVDLPGDDEKYTGNYSDVRIYATALSADEILTMYKTSGIIDNKNNVYTYEFQENEKNMMWYINNAIIDKTYKDGLASYTQTNCQVTLTDDGYRVYRPPNLLYSEAKNTMWGGLKININNANHKDHVRENLQTGHKYIILYDVKGQTSKAQTSIGWTNLMGWGGGGLNPTPSNAQYRAIPANFESDEWQTFFYKWDLTDDVYKVCTQSYSSFVKGNTYLSYADFQIGWTYEDTGTLGTDVYIKNIRMYDITDMAKPKLMKTGVFNIDEIHENNKTKVRQNEIEANSFIEI